MVLASYMDIKTRTIQNHLWIFFGLVGISFLEIQVIIEFGLKDSFEYLILMVPLLILFLSFLICDYVYDREKRKVNEPWVFLVTLAGFVFFYLTFIGDNLSDPNTSKIQITLPIILYISYFILIQALLNYLLYRAYKKYLKIKSKLKAKSKKERQNEQLKEQKPIKVTELFEQRFSWAVFFGALGFIIIVFVMNEIVMMEEARMIGYIVLVLIPIFLILLYYRYLQDLNTKSKQKVRKDRATKTSSDENYEDDLDIPFDDPDFRPPNQILVLLSFYGLIIFGFLTILYYSSLDLLTNFYVQVFILMAWVFILYGFYNVGVPKGGADTKALMALVILFPMYPIIQYITLNTPFFEFIEQFPVTAYIFPFVFSTLINAAFVVLFYVIILVFYNASKHNIKFPHALLGYKVPINQVHNRFVWLMERVDEGVPKLIAFPKDNSNLQNELKLLKKHGVTHVWVTPQIPFIIPLTIGLILTTTIGNIIFLIIGLI